MNSFSFWFICCSNCNKSNNNNNIDSVSCAITSTLRWLTCRLSAISLGSSSWEHPTWTASLELHSSPGSEGDPCCLSPSSAAGSALTQTTSRGWSWKLEEVVVVEAGEEQGEGHSEVWTCESVPGQETWRADQGNLAAPSDLKGTKQEALDGKWLVRSDRQRWDSLLRPPTCRWRSGDDHGDLSTQLQQLTLQRRDLLQGARISVLALHSSPPVGLTGTCFLVSCCVPAGGTLLLWGQKVPAKTKDEVISKAVDQRYTLKHVRTHHLVCVCVSVCVCFVCCLLTWSWQMSPPHPHKPTGHQQKKGWQVALVQLELGSWRKGPKESQSSYYYFGYCNKL